MESRPLTSSEVRAAFLDFFRQRQHVIVPSAPLVSKDDPTLLFVNSGMAPFKDIFTGNKPVQHPRVADTQKCLRVSGKHNDLEEVGYDTYHHTLFEMLGNWSFGDYFKAEAIEWSFAFLTQTLGLDPSRMYATYFEGSEGVPADEEALAEWRKYLPEDHILKGNKKDNFWEMGETGPCGPCTEIHYDARPEADRQSGKPGAELVNSDHPQVIEIWNNVFMQFERRADGTLIPLKMKSVDTGMGFERLCMVLQGKQSTYDTDVFAPLIQHMLKLSGRTSYQPGAIKFGDPVVKEDVAIRVAVDHIRAISLAIADGQLPGAGGAGYVIRRLIRRASRYGYQFLGLKTPFLHTLVPVLADYFRGTFDELVRQQDFVKTVIEQEEKSFLLTLEKGLRKIEYYFNYLHPISLDQKFNFTQGFNLNNVKLLRRTWIEQLVKKEILKIYGKGIEYSNLQVWPIHLDNPNLISFEYRFDETDHLNDTEHLRVHNLQITFSDSLISNIDGDTAFELYDTFGFPLDLTQLIARENGWTVDVAGFDAAMAEQKARSKAAAQVQTGDWVEVIPGFQDVLFVGYDALAVEAEIVKYRSVQSAKGTNYQIVLTRTPFYAESGGQVGDTGTLTNGSETLRVLDTKKDNQLTVHWVDRLPTDASGTWTATVDTARRRAISANHSATHLLHAALRQVLGTHVEQRGSLVNPEYLRFDFSHFGKVEEAQLAAIEQIVNERIMASIPLVEYRDLPIAEAKAKGAMALFGEKYGERVRVIEFDPSFSVELCGGTHVPNTSYIRQFKITSEASSSAGIRRIEALSAEGASRWYAERLAQLDRVRELLKQPRDIEKAVTDLLEANRVLQTKLEAQRAEAIVALRRELTAQFEAVNGRQVLVTQVAAENAEELKTLAFELRKAVPGSAIVLGAVADGKPLLAVMLDDALVAGGLDAKAIIGPVAKHIQGGGGGQPFFATAGGKNPDGMAAALEAARELLK